MRHDGLTPKESVMRTVLITPRRYAPSRPARSPRPRPPLPPVAPGLLTRWKTAWLLECARFVPTGVLAPKPRVSRRV